MVLRRKNGVPAVVAARLSVVITLAAENYLGSRPRYVADGCDYLLRGALAHHAPCSPADDRPGTWHNVCAWQGHQGCSIALSVYQDLRRRWHRIAQGSQLLGAGSPSLRGLTLAAQALRVPPIHSLCVTKRFCKVLLL